MEIPQKYKDLVGTKQTLSGGLFSHRRDESGKEYNIIDIRWGTAIVINFKELKETGQSSYEHPTFELLVKRDGMKQSRWTRGFAIYEIDLKKQEVV